MAVFLKVDGIEGESTAEQHPKEIEVSAWSFGVTSSGASHMGGGAGASRSTFSDLATTKLVDKATPKLLLAAASGRHIREATLSVTTAGPTPHDALVLVVSDVVVTSCLVADAADPGDGRPVENLGLSFGTIRVRYAAQSPTGALEPAAEFGWDVARNRPL